MTTFFLLVSISIQVIFMLYRPILFKKWTFKILFSVAAIVFALYYLLKGLGYEYPNMELIQIPLLALIIFRIMNFTYHKMYGKDFESSSYAYGSMGMKQLKDGIITALFWAFGFILPLFLVEKVF